MSNSTTISQFVVTLDNASFCIYLICASLLILKMMCVTLLTIYMRYKHKAFICPEDAKWFNGEVVVNDSVERVRRAYQNDLENIPLFLVASFAYLWTQPPFWLTFCLFCGFTLVRLLHSVVYTIIILPQPTRAILWLVGFLITGYVCAHVALYVCVYLITYNL